MTDRSIKALLAASVLLNLLLVGGIGGGIWWAWRQPEVRAAVVQAQPAAAQRGLRFSADALAAPQRQAFRNGLRDARRESADAVAASRAGRLEVAHLIAAPQFDRAAVESALQRTRDADLALRARLESSVAGFAATLTPPERIQLVEGLSTQGPLRVAPAAKP